MILTKPWYERLLALGVQFPSDDLRGLLPRLETRSDWGAPIGNYEKAFVAPTIRRLIGEQLLKEAWLVNNGAFLDIEWPLLCGARKILLVDPDYEQLGSDLEERLEELKAEMNLGVLPGLDLDLGDPDKDIEHVVVRYEPISAQDFSPNEALAGIISYQTPGLSWLELPDQLAKLAVGGVIFQNIEQQLWWVSAREFEQRGSSVWDDAPPQMDEPITEDTDPHDPLYRAWVEFASCWTPAWNRNAKKLGLERILVPRWHKVMPPHAFYKKVDDNEELIKLARAYREARASSH